MFRQPPQGRWRRQGKGAPTTACNQGERFAITFSSRSHALANARKSKQDQQLRLDYVTPKINKSDKEMPTPCPLAALHYTQQQGNYFFLICPREKQKKKYFLPKGAVNIKAIQA